MKTTLIITTYNWKEALETSLKSVFTQTRLPDEIIIADDGSRNDTKHLIEKMSLIAPCPIIHSWHEDKGFRAALSRNKAIKKSSGNYIIFIDGDIILEPHFIQDHIECSKKNRFIQGSRVLLTQELYKPHFFSKGISNRKNTIRSNMLSALFSREKNSLSGSRTCNFSLFKDAIIKVNGFDNDFIGWGREDSEFVNRLLCSGLKRYNLKFKALAYHLYHEENSKKALIENDKRLKQSIEKKLKTCFNGINKISTKE